MNDGSREHFGEVRLDIAGWRAHRGMTQWELAASAGMAVGTIKNIETGKSKPRPSTLRRIAKALDTEVWNLGND